MISMSNTRRYILVDISQLVNRDNDSPKQFGHNPWLQPLHDRETCELDRLMLEIINDTSLSEDEQADRYKKY